MTKEKAMYQVLKIIECLPDNEYEAIPQDMLEFVNNNYEYDEQFELNPSVPLEKQNIDEKAYIFLSELIKRSEDNIRKNIKGNAIERKILSKDDAIRRSIEINQLKVLTKKYEELNSKMSDMEQKLQDYEKIISSKDEIIGQLLSKNKKLIDYINIVPSWIKKLFMKDIKLLLE